MCIRVQASRSVVLDRHLDANRIAPTLDDIFFIPGVEVTLPTIVDGT